MKPANSEQVQAKLNEIETAIIERMAKATGYQPFQMASMIKRIPELNAYYKQVRETVIRELAA